MPEAIPFPQPTARVERRRILNDTTIRGLKPPATGRVDYFDDATPGLSLRVTAQDVRTWTVFYRDKHGRRACRCLEVRLHVENPRTFHGDVQPQIG